MRKFILSWKGLNAIGLLLAVAVTPFTQQYVIQGMEWVAKSAVGQFTAPIVGASWIIRAVVLDYFNTRVKIPSKTAKTEKAGRMIATKIQ